MEASAASSGARSADGCDGVPRNGDRTERSTDDASASDTDGDGRGRPAGDRGRSLRRHGADAARRGCGRRAGARALSGGASRCMCCAARATMAATAMWRRRLLARIRRRRAPLAGRSAEGRHGRGAGRRGMPGRGEATRGLPAGPRSPGDRRAVRRRPVEAARRVSTARRSSAAGTSARQVLAVDLPSGVSGSSGARARRRHAGRSDGDLLSQEAGASALSRAPALRRDDRRRYRHRRWCSRRDPAALFRERAGALGRCVSATGGRDATNMRAAMSACFPAARRRPVRRGCRRWAPRASGRAR